MYQSKHFLNKNKDEDNSLRNKKKCLQMENRYELIYLYERMV